MIIFFLSAVEGLGVPYLYKQHTAAVLGEALDSYEVEAQWSAATCQEHLLLCRLVQGPVVVPAASTVATSATVNGGIAIISTGSAAGYVVQSDSALLAKLLRFLCTVHMSGAEDGENKAIFT